jgi:hypothetical protein
VKWFVILVVIATKPTLYGEPAYVPGDVVETIVMASAKGATPEEQEANCHKGGAILRDALQEAGQDSVKAIYVCEQLPASVEEAQTSKREPDGP